MKKLQKLNLDLFDESKLSSDKMKKIYGGLDDYPGGPTQSTLCTGKAGTTHPSGTFADNDPCTDS